MPTDLPYLVFTQNIRKALSAKALTDPPINVDDIQRQNLPLTTYPSKAPGNSVDSEKKIKPIWDIQNSVKRLCKTYLIKL